MNRIIKILILILILFGLVYMLEFIYTTSHENVHLQIYTYFGCKNATYDINYLWLNAVSECNDVEKTHSLEEVQLHSLNEIIGYAVYSLGIFILVGIIMLFIINKWR